MDIQQITVPVPSDRITDFYRWFADWRDGSLPPSSDPAPHGRITPPVDADERLASAVSWWGSLTANERAIWGLWIEAAPKLLTADTIVDELGLKGPRDIPGILSWSGRKGQEAGFSVEWRFTSDPVTEAPMYGLKDVNDLSAVEYADLLRRARAEAEA